TRLLRGAISFPTPLAFCRPKNYKKCENDDHLCPQPKRPLPNARTLVALSQSAFGGLENSSSSRSFLALPDMAALASINGLTLSPGPLLTISICRSRSAGFHFG